MNVKDRDGKALEILVLGAKVNMHPVACFPLSKTALIKGVLDGVTYGVDERIKRGR